MRLDCIHFQGVPAPSPGGNGPGRVSGNRTLLKQRAAAPAAKLDPFLEWLLGRGGIPAGAYRTVPLQRRLPALLRLLRVDSPRDAQALLEAKPHLLRSALSSLLIGVSSFFRDPMVFDRLRESLLPELLRSRGGVRVVGAGASDGHELYSMAILLAEAGVLRQSSLLGIDCRPDAIERARLGCFPDGEVAAVGKAWRERYFQKEGTLWRADAKLRGSIRWCCADLLTFSPPPCDIALFRNVAIYLRDDSTLPVWERIVSALTPGGFLVTGKAEKPPSGLPLQCVFKSIYQKSIVAP